MKNIRTSAQDHNFRKVCTFTSVMHILTISLDLDLCLAGLKVLRYFHTLFVLVSSCLLLLYGCKFFLSFFFNDFCTCFMRDQYFHFSSVSYLWLHLNTIYCNYHLILFNLFGNYNHGNSKCLINYLKLFHISKLEIENLPQSFTFKSLEYFCSERWSWYQSYQILELQMVDFTTSFQAMNSTLEVLIVFQNSVSTSWPLLTK